MTKMTTVSIAHVVQDVCWVSRSYTVIMKWNCCWYCLSIHLFIFVRWLADWLIVISVLFKPLLLIIIFHRLYWIHHDVFYYSSLSLGSFTVIPWQIKKQTIQPSTTCTRRSRISSWWQRIKPTQTPYCSQKTPTHSHGRR